MFPIGMRELTGPKSVRPANDLFLQKQQKGIRMPTPPLTITGAARKPAGLLRGAYHFFRSNVDPKKQATKFIDYVKSMNDNGELPPVLDLETPDGQAKEKIISRAKTWLDLVEAAFGRKPIIYSGQFFLQDHFSEVGGGPPAWAKEYPLWLAQYPNNHVEGSQPALPRGWFKWTFWQYSEKGVVNGINAKVDLDVFNGTLEELYKFAGAQLITEKPQTPQKHAVAAGDLFESIANKYGVTVRELVSANPQLLKTGDQLTIPVAVAIPSESSPGSNSPSTPRTSCCKTGGFINIHRHQVRHDGRRDCLAKQYYKHQ